VGTDLYLYPYSPGIRYPTDIRYPPARPLKFQQHSNTILPEIISTFKQMMRSKSTNGLTCAAARPDADRGCAEAVRLCCLLAVTAVRLCCLLADSPTRRGPWSVLSGSAGAWRPLEPGAAERWSRRVERWTGGRLSGGRPGRSCRAWRWRLPGLGLGLVVVVVERWTAVDP
jgi:hypothetical protein